MFILLLVLIRVIKFYDYLLFIYALISWFPGAYDTQFGRFLAYTCEPIIRPFRRLHLQFFGLDFTIMLVAIILNNLPRLLLFLIGLIGI